MSDDRILTELLGLRQEVEFAVADIQSLRVELVRVLDSQRAETEANKKKSHNSGKFLNGLLNGSRASKHIYRKTKRGGWTW